MPGEVERVIAIGASNLTRGLQTVVATARAAWGPGIQVLAALGHGRSYGAHSRLVIRTLPGILESGLWRELERLPAVTTRALITDVGNDILYGFSAAQTLDWVEESAVRLQRYTRDIVLTDLPLASLRRLSSARFLLFRSILVPRCRLSLESVLRTAKVVSEGLATLAAARGLGFFRLRPEWYGFDPIHIRPHLWGQAWREIIGAEPKDPGARGETWMEGLGLYLRRPERQWLFGIERVTPQSGVALPRGGRLWLF